MSQHISAVALVVPDYDAGIDFYVGTLGFDLIEDTQQSATKRWVLIAPKDAQTRLLLAKADGPEQSAAIGNQTGGRVGFFLHTDDFDADHARMLAAGVQFEETPRHEPYGSVAVFRDPFGNRWDLLQLNAYFRMLLNIDIMPHASHIWCRPLERRPCSFKQNPRQTLPR